MKSSPFVRLLLPVIGLASLFGSGCVTNPYPNYAADSATFKQLRTSVDIFVSDDIKGSLDQVDAVRNQEMALQVAEELRAGLEAKGYTIAADIPISVGYMAGKATRLKVIGYSGPDVAQAVEPTVDELADIEEGVTDEALIMYTPFFYDEASRADQSRQFDLIALHEKVSAFDFRSKHKALSFPEVSRLGVDEDDAMLIVLISGRRVPTGKQVGQAVLTAALTLGTIAVWEADQLKVKMAIAKSDGRILWCSSGYLKVSPEPRQLSNMIKRLLKELPNKLPYAPPGEAAPADSDAEELPLVEPVAI